MVTRQVYQEYTQIIEEHDAIYLSLAQYQAVDKKELASGQHTRSGRLSPKEHLNQLTREGIDLDHGQPLMVVSTRNVMSNLRCIAYLAEKPGYAQVSEEVIPSRPYHILGLDRSGKLSIGSFDTHSEDPSQFSWFLSGVPVLWGDGSEEELFQRIVTEASDHSHIWRIHRGNHPFATDESRKIWEELQSIFVRTLGDPRESAYEDLVSLAEKKNLEREDLYLHNILGVDRDGTRLYQLIGIGRLEELGQRIHRMGATHAICVDNGGSPVVLNYSKGYGHEPIQEFAAPNHRPMGTAYLVIQLKGTSFYYNHQNPNSTSTANQTFFMIRLEIIRNQLMVYDYGGPEDLVNEESYIPRYLRSFEKADGRRRLGRYLETLKEILQSNQSLPDDLWSSHTQILEQVLLAILYADYEPKPLFEEDANLKLEERLADDAQNRLFRDIKPDKEKIKLLIRYHKIACLVLEKRLSENVARKINDKFGIESPFLGLIAAACYDSPGQYEKARKIERIKKLIETWKNITEYTTPKLVGLNDAVILFDLPLCEVDESGARKGFHRQSLKNFLDIYHEVGIRNIRRSDLLYYTCNAPQSRWIYYKIGSQKEATPALGEYIEKLRKPKPDIRRFCFALIEQAVISDGWKKESLEFLEFRLKFEDAVKDLLGLRGALDVRMEDWLKAVHDIPTMHKKISNDQNPDLEAVGYYPIPVKDYFPLPLLTRFFEIANDYAENYQDKTIKKLYDEANPKGVGPLPLFNKINYKFTGQLDLSFSRNISLHIPVLKEIDRKKTSADVIPTIEKYLAAYFTNIGVCTGYDRNIVSITPPSGIDENWLSRLDGMLTNPNFGYELFVRYIETYMRAHDVNVSNRNLVEPGDYNKLLDDLRLVDRFIPGDNLCSSEKKFYIGIDIGATSIKFKLYNHLEEEVAVHRVATLKDPTNPNRKYENLGEFAKRLFDGIRNLSHKHFKNAPSTQEILQSIEVIGICWPSAIREQKIAGASKILGYFKESISSSFIRRNTVESIRKLDLIEELKRVMLDALKEKLDYQEAEQKENVFLELISKLTIGLCNDGYAEALGRLRRNDLLRLDYRWAILKLGTGTAGRVFDHRRIHGGPQEFGKLILNVYVKNSDRHKVGEDSVPDGLVNRFASQNLLPNVFCDLINNKDFKITSFEVGQIAQFFLQDENRNLSEMAIQEVPEIRLVRKIGLESEYTSKYEHLFTKNLMDDLVYDRKSARDLAGEVYKDYEPLGKKGEPTREELENALASQLEKYQGGESIEKIGYQRLREIFFAISPILVKDSEKLDSLKIEFEVSPDPSKSIVSGIFKALEKSTLRSRFKAVFEEVYDRAGSILADVIMLVREYYHMNGIVLCGGVLQTSEPTRRMLLSAREHLKRKYMIHFASWDEYEEDVKNKRVGKYNFLKIYHNFSGIDTVDFCDMTAVVNPVPTTPFIDTVNSIAYKGVKLDLGEIGALTHAKIQHLIKQEYLESEKVVCVNSSGVQYDQPKPSYKFDFEKDEYIAREIVALLDKDKKEIFLLRRARDLNDGDRLLFQSGKLNIKDVEACRNGETAVIPMKEVAMRGVMRELLEELRFQVDAEQIEYVGPERIDKDSPLLVVQEEPLKKNLYYPFIVDVTGKAHLFKPDCTIRGYPEGISINQKIDQFTDGETKKKFEISNVTQKLYDFMWAEVQKRYGT